MLQQIADLVEFDLNRFSTEKVIEDFNHKFNSSILKIDGTYYKVLLLEQQRKDLVLHVLDKEGNEIIFTKAKTLEKVTPKTGLYASPHGLLYLYRLPKRQWIKSLSLNNNYDTQVLANKNGVSIWNTVLVDNPTYDKESIIYEDLVFLHWKKVGKVIDGIIHVTREKFIEEIKELWNQLYQITLDVNNPQPKVEKLILDW